MIPLFLLEQFFLNVSLLMKSFVVLFLIISFEIIDELCGSFSFYIVWDSWRLGSLSNSIRWRKSVSRLFLARPISRCIKFCTGNCDLSSSMSHPTWNVQIALELRAHIQWERLVRLVGSSDWQSEVVYTSSKRVLLSTVTGECVWSASPCVCEENNRSTMTTSLKLLMDTFSHDRSCVHLESKSSPWATQITFKSTACKYASAL